MKKNVLMISLLAMSVGFTACNKDNGNPDTSIPEGTADVTIEENAFKQCSSLNSTKITSDVISIESNAFNGCTKLHEVVRKDGQWEEIEDDKIQEFFDNLVETAKNDNSSDK